MSSKNKKKQTYFDKTWLEHEDFLQWVAVVKNEPTMYDVKFVTRQMDYQIWELVPVKFVSNVLMKLIKRKLRFI